MDTETARLADFHRRSLDFMLGALGLPPAPPESEALIRVFELEQQVTALLAENRWLRTRLRVVEQELHPEEAELDAWEREVETRLAGDLERRRGADARGDADHPRGADDI